MKLRVAKKVLGFTARRSWSWQPQFRPRLTTWWKACRRWHRYFNREPLQVSARKVMALLEDHVRHGKPLPDEITL